MIVTEPFVKVTDCPLKVPVVAPFRVIVSLVFGNTLASCIRLCVESDPRVVLRVEVVGVVAFANGFETEMFCVVMVKSPSGGGTGSGSGVVRRVTKS